MFIEIYRYQCELYLGAKTRNAIGSKRRTHIDEDVVSKSRAIEYNLSTTHQTVKKKRNPANDS